MIIHLFYFDDDDNDGEDDMGLPRLWWKQGSGALLRAYAEALCSPRQPHKQSARKNALVFCGPRGISLVFLSGYSSLSEGAGSEDQSQGRRDMEEQRQSAWAWEKPVLGGSENG